jgi:serine/threonine-protein kinase HipA
MKSSARVCVYRIFAGRLCATTDGIFMFTYDSDYLNSKNPKPVSLTLPTSQALYESQVLFPFFDGLIPEGWLLEIAVKNWKVDVRDRMALLLCTSADCIGAVHLEREDT